MVSPSRGPARYSSLLTRPPLACGRAAMQPQTPPESPAAENRRFVVHMPADSQRTHPLSDSQRAPDPASPSPIARSPRAFEIVDRPPPTRCQHFKHFVCRTAEFLFGIGMLKCHLLLYWLHATLILIQRDTAQAKRGGAKEQGWHEQYEYFMQSVNVFVAFFAIIGLWAEVGFLLHPWSLIVLYQLSVALSFFALLCVSGTNDTDNGGMFDAMKEVMAKFALSSEDAKKELDGVMVAQLCLFLYFLCLFINIVNVQALFTEREMERRHEETMRQEMMRMYHLRRIHQYELMAAGLADNHPDAPHDDPPTYNAALHLPMPDPSEKEEETETPPPNYSYAEGRRAQATQASHTDRRESGRG